MTECVKIACSARAAAGGVRGNTFYRGKTFITKRESMQQRVLRNAPHAAFIIHATALSDR